MRERVREREIKREKERDKGRKIERATFLYIYKGKVKDILLLR